MILGVVSADLEARVGLDLVGADAHRQTIEAVIDTGFSGFLTLPPALVTALGLPWPCREQGILADGSAVLFDAYEATVLWDGLPRRVQVEAADAEPLLGMALLQGHELRIQVAGGGAVTIARLP